MDVTVSKFICVLMYSVTGNQLTFKELTVAQRYNL